MSRGLEQSRTIKKIDAEHLDVLVHILYKGSRTKKKLADFETFAQIWVGGSGKNLIH